MDKSLCKRWFACSVTGNTYIHWSPHKQQFVWEDNISRATLFKTEDEAINFLNQFIFKDKSQQIDRYIKVDWCYTDRETI